MRNAFAKEITELAADNEEIVLLAGDIGNRLFNSYKERCPDRFFNCGVAEANMTGVAAGLALCGLRPLTYTITPFVTTRCLEQIRNDICYHSLPVIIVGVGSGLSYAGLGPTHHSCEDIALLRALPEMSVVCPADVVEVKAALQAAIKHDGPLYLRLGKKGEPVVHTKEIDFRIGKAILMSEGNNVCLLSTGNMLPTAIEAAENLNQQGISTGVVSFHTVKPLDRDCLEKSFNSYDLVVTIEEHSLIGGFGSAVAEWLCDGPKRDAELLRIGTSDAFLHESGGQSHARAYYGISAEAITQKVSERHRLLRREPAELFT